MNNSGGLISASTAIDDSALSSMRVTVEAMDMAAIFGLFFQVLFVSIATQIISAFIFVVIYGRMLEIYLSISLAPIPFATFGNREQSQIGQNYLRGLFALGFQGFLIMVCIAIYAVMILVIRAMNVEHFVLNVNIMTFVARIMYLSKEERGGDHTDQYEGWRHPWKRKTE